MKKKSDSAFWEKYKDPRWQMMRLRIMERDEAACRGCRAKDKTLNVHHSYYTKGADPWEYPEASLVTLCEDCHTDITVDTIALNALTETPEWKKKALEYIRVLRAQDKDVTEGVFHAVWLLPQLFEYARKITALLREGETVDAWDMFLYYKGTVFGIARHLGRVQDVLEDPELLPK